MVWNFVKLNKGDINFWAKKIIPVLFKVMNCDDPTPSSPLCLFLKREKGVIGMGYISQTLFLKALCGHAEF